MHTPITGEAARALMDDAILSSPELELYRDVFQAVYGTHCQGPYDRFFNEPPHALDARVAAYCRGVIAKRRAAA